MMKLTVNGQLKEFESACDLQSLASSLCSKIDHVIAEVNGNIIKKEIWNETSLSDGDQIELISFVGGG